MKNDVASSKVKLLNDIHTYGPRYLRDLRREHGAIIDPMLRRRELQRLRIRGGDVLVLGPKGRKALGLHPTYEQHARMKPIYQQMIRGAALRNLEDQGYVFEENRNPYLSVMRSATGTKTLVAVNHGGYHRRSFLRLVSESLIGDLLGGADLIVFDPNPKRLAKAAPHHDNLYELRHLNTVPAPLPTPLST